MTLFQIVVILVNYNSFEDTKECIKSIVENEEVDSPIVIVDNNSSDAHLLDRLKEDYSNLEIIKNASNVGFGRANNIGIQWAFKNLEFEYLLLLNNDTVITKNAISKLITPFKKDSAIGVTTSKIMYDYNNELVWYGGGKINYKRGWPKITDYNQKSTEEGANRSKYVSFVSGCVMMFSRECIEELKGFDEDFFMYCEDLELSLRAKKNGFKLWYVAESTILHKVQGSFSKKNTTGFNKNNPNLPFVYFHMKSNQWIAMKKHFKKKKFLKFSFFYVNEMVYNLFKFIIWGRFDMLKPTYKVVNNMFK